MKDKDIEFAVMFASMLRKDMIENGEHMDEWNLSIDKIVEHADKIRKLNPSNRVKFLLFMHEKDIITPTEKGKKELNNIIDKINKIKSRSLKNEQL